MSSIKVILSLANLEKVSLSRPKRWEYLLPQRCNYLTFLGTWVGSGLVHEQELSVALS